MVYSLAVMIFVDDIVMGVSSFQILIYLGDFRYFSALNSDSSVDMNSLSVALDNLTTVRTTSYCFSNFLNAIYDIMYSFI